MLITAVCHAWQAARRSASRPRRWRRRARSPRWCRSESPPRIPGPRYHGTRVAEYPASLVSEYPATIFECWQLDLILDSWTVWFGERRRWRRRSTTSWRAARGAPACAPCRAASARWCTSSRSTTPSYARMRTCAHAPTRMCASILWAYPRQPAALESTSAKEAGG